MTETYYSHSHVKNNSYLNKDKFTKTKSEYKVFDLKQLEQPIYLESFAYNFVEDVKMIINIVKNSDKNILISKFSTNTQRIQKLMI